MTRVIIVAAAASNSSRTMIRPRGGLSAGDGNDGEGASFGAGVAAAAALRSDANGLCFSSESGGTGSFIYRDIGRFPSEIDDAREELPRAAV